MSLETLEDDERMPMSGERSGSRSRYSGHRVDREDEDDDDDGQEGEEDDDDDDIDQERNTRGSDHLGGNGYGAVNGKGNGHLKGANLNGFQLPRRTVAPKGIVHGKLLYVVLSHKFLAEVADSSSFFLSSLSSSSVVPVNLDLNIDPHSRSPSKPLPGPSDPSDPVHCSTIHIREF
jgi:hypothetical protein